MIDPGDTLTGRGAAAVAGVNDGVQGCLVRNLSKRDHIRFAISDLLLPEVAECGFLEITREKEDPGCGIADALRIVGITSRLVNWVIMRIRPELVQSIPAIELRFGYNPVIEDTEFLLSNIRSRHASIYPSPRI